MSIKEFHDDENKLLEVILDNTLFTPSKQIGPNIQQLHDTTRPRFKQGLNVELIVRPECNQHCKYCYIANYGDQLYPKEERVDNITILRNLRSFLNYTINEKHTFINHWELFAGDLFYDNLYFDIIDIFYEYFKPIQEMYHAPVVILTPCNCSFISNEQKRNKFDEYYNKMKEINISLVLSYSGDGKYVTETREQKEVTDEYYDILRKFLDKYDYGAHPMICAESIKKQKENFDWWVDFYKKREAPMYLPMFLEVRNDDWTNESIYDYLELLQHMIDYRLKELDNNIDDFAYQLFAKVEQKQYNIYNKKSPMTCNDLLKLYYLKESQIEYEQMPCSIQNLVHITLNNLSIVPCHRTSYPQFVAGHFIQDKTGKITGVEAKNLAIWITTHYCKVNTFTRCICCAFSPICQKGCFGAQFESSGELFEPLASVCKLLKAKYTFLIRQYTAMGIFDSALKQGLMSQQEYNYYKTLLLQIQQEQRDNG